MPAAAAEATGTGVLAFGAAAGTFVRKGVLGRTGPFDGAAAAVDGVVALVVVAGLAGVLAVEPGCVAFLAAAVCELVGIEGLIGAGSTGLGSVVIGCKDVAEPGGRGSDVVGVTGAAVPAEVAGIAGLTGEAAFPFVPAVFGFVVAAAGAGEAAGVDLAALAAAGAVAGLAPVVAVAGAAGLPGVEGLASFFCAATCCNRIRSFKCVTR